MFRIVAAAISLLVVAVAAGCSGPDLTAEPIATATPNLSAASSATAAPEFPSPSASLPDVPAGLPIMPGAVADGAAASEPGVVARWMVHAIGPLVYRYYLDALPAAGFFVEDRFPGGNVAIVRFTSPDGTTLDLALIGEGDGSQTRIELVVPEGP